MTLPKSPVSPGRWPVAMLAALGVVKVGYIECGLRKPTPALRSASMAGAASGVTLPARSPSGTNSTTLWGSAATAGAASIRAARSAARLKIPSPQPPPARGGGTKRHRISPSPRGRGSGGGVAPASADAARPMQACIAFRRFMAGTIAGAPDGFVTANLAVCGPSPRHGRGHMLARASPKRDSFKWPFADDPPRPSSPRDYAAAGRVGGPGRALRGDVLALDDRARPLAGRAASGVHAAGTADRADEPAFRRDRFRRPPGPAHPREAGGGLADRAPPRLYGRRAGHHGQGPGDGLLGAALRARQAEADASEKLRLGLWPCDALDRLRA